MLNKLKEIKSLLGFNEAQTLFGFVLLVYAITNPNPSLSLLFAYKIFLALGISTAVHNADVIAKLTRSHVLIQILRDIFKIKYSFISS